MRITVHGRGAHGSMPQAAVDPVVLAAMIVVRLQTVVSREVGAGGDRGAHRRQHPGGHEEQRHPRPGRAAAQRAHLQRGRPARTILDAIRRIVTRGVRRRRAARGSRSSSCSTGSRSPTTTPPPPSGWPRRSRTSSATAAGAGRPAVGQRGLQRHPRPRWACPTPTGSSAASTPSTYDAAEQAGRVAQDIPVNHSAAFAPVIQPTLDTGTQALVVAALAWLAPLSRAGQSSRARPRRLPRRCGRVEVEADADHADDEAQRRGRRPRAASAVGAQLGGDHDGGRRRPARGWRRARCCSTDGTCRISTSRSVPPPTPVIAPRMTACAGPKPEVERLAGPGDGEQAQPAASSTLIGLVSRSRRRPKTKAISPPPAATAR